MLSLVVAGVLASSVCTGGAGHVEKRLVEVAPQLTTGRFGKLFKSLAALDPESALEVDERHVTFTLAGDKAPPAVRAPLALPSPWSGYVDVVPQKTDARWCAAAQVVLFDKELREAELVGVPFDVTVTVQKKGQPARTLPMKHDALVFSPDTLVLKVAPREDAADAGHGDEGVVRLYVGDGPPPDEVLEQDGADLYLKSLAALDPAIVDEMRHTPSREAQRVLFAELAAALRTGLRAWTPEKRIAEIARFDESAMPEEMKPLVHFWKMELGTSSAKKEVTAHLIVDDAVQALWVDGVEVFSRKRGLPTGFDLRVPREAVRAWIVTEEGGASVVHDTRAVLQAGEIYSVTSTFVQHARGGTRRECLRVVGKLPFGKDIRWREISGTHTPMLGDDESYRPSAASAERAISVVPGGDARPFPPVPLVYSYTHPGLYKWTLAKDGAVRLELIGDEALCKPKP